MIEPLEFTVLVTELADSAPSPMALFERGGTEPIWSNKAFLDFDATSQVRIALGKSLSGNENSQNKNSPWVIIPLSNPQFLAVFWSTSHTNRRESATRITTTQIDHTTQLATRGELEALAQQWMTERQQRPFGVLFIDLDDFKQVNDSQGHLAGDEQLRQVGEALKHSLREGDFVARFGGDEFVALIAGNPNAAELEHLADRLGRTIDQHAHIGASIGSALSQDHATLTELLTAADRAMYADKNRRSGGEARL